MQPTGSAADGVRRESSWPPYGATAVVRVAFQGELGAYSHEAIVHRWRGDAQPVPAASFTDVLEVVANGSAEYGVIPVWNSVVGDVAAGRDAVLLGGTDAYGLAVVGDTHVVVRHQLLAPAGTSLDEIHTVESHPTALAQCGGFLARHPRITPKPVYDTAGAARELARWRTPGHAAIAGRRAAERYRLEVIASDIQDVPDNVTHFMVLAPRAVARRSGGAEW